MQVESVNFGEAAPTLDNKPPKVSVCVVTYNQEKYIAQCLQSIVDQVTDFDFEIIVGDDCSTDGTRDIVREFAEKYSGKFRILFHSQNIGAAFNYSKTHELAIGKYVAHMDGDDLMLPCKLQKQINAFAENPDCVMVSHDMLLINEDNEINKRTFKKHRAGINTIWDLYEILPFFANSSKMIKKDIDLKILGIIAQNTLDVELHVATAEDGDIYHLDEPLGSYRTGVGMSSVKKKSVNPILVEGVVRIFEASIKKYPERAMDLKRNYARAMLNYAYQSAILKNTENFNEFLMRSINVLHYSVLQTVFLKIPNIIIFEICRIRNKIRYKK